MKVSYKCKVC